MTSKRYLSIELPDQEATIDFLSRNHTPGFRVPGCSVKLRIDFDKKTGEASLYIFAQDDGDQSIMIDQSFPLLVEEIDKEAADDGNDD